MATVESYEVGSAATISLTVTKDGVLTDPATIALTITLPDASTVTKAITDFTHVSLGRFDYDYTTTQAGRHTWHAVTTTPATVADGGFLVVASPETAVLVDPTDYARVTGDTTTDWATVAVALAEALDVAEQHCNRRFAFASYTETLYVYRDGKVYPTNTPLVAVSNPAVAATAIQGAGVYLGVFLPTPALVNAGDWNAAVPPQVAVTYTGGYTIDGKAAPKIPVTLRNAICRIAYNMLHPAVLTGVPAGATSVHVGDVGYSGQALRGLDALDDGIRRDLKRYQKRKVRGWQRG